MKLWRISQNINYGYDIYDSAVVAAESEEEARLIHPHNVLKWGGVETYDWAPAKDVIVEFIGTAKEGTAKGVIVASFNAE